MLKVKFTKDYDLSGHKEGDELVLKDHSSVPTHLIPLVEILESDSESEVKDKKKKKGNEDK